MACFTPHLPSCGFTARKCLAFFQKLRIWLLSLGGSAARREEAVREKPEVEPLEHQQWSCRVEDAARPMFDYVCVRFHRTGHVSRFSRSFASGYFLLAAPPLGLSN